MLRFSAFLLFILLNSTFSIAQNAKKANNRISIDTTAIELEDYKSAVLFYAALQAEFFDDTEHDSIFNNPNEDLTRAVNSSELNTDTLKSRL